MDPLEIEEGLFTLKIAAMNVEVGDTTLEIVLFTAEAVNGNLML